MPVTFQRRRVISRRNFVIVVCSAIGFLALVGIVAGVVALFGGSGGDPFENGGGRCFFVDMLEQRVPHFEMPLIRREEGHLHRAHPPLAYGRICFDKQQLMVEWKFHQSYYRLYTLSDMVIRGPLKDNDDEHHAPIVLALGVQTGNKHRLTGSTIIERHLIEEILKHPTRYYVSLEGDYAKYEQSVDAARKREIGRHNLNLSI
jgi:hypothetical protein